MGFDIKIYGCIHNKKTQMLIHTVNGVDHDCDRVVFFLVLRFNTCFVDIQYSRHSSARTAVHIQSLGSARRNAEHF